MKTELKISLFVFLLVFVLSMALLIFPWQRLLGGEGHKSAAKEDHCAACSALDTSELILIFLSGFLGGAHCVGMCGGVVAGYSFKLNQEKSRRYGALPHLWFNSGRVVTYMFIGALAGALGSLIMKNPWLKTGQKIMPFFIGAIMVLMALSFAGLLPVRLNIFSADAQEAGSGGGILNRLITGVMVDGKGTARHAPASFSLFILGLLVGFLPCGLVYAVAAKAVTGGSFLKGGVALGVFGLGTWPALLLLGAASSKLSVFDTLRQRLWIYRLAAASIGILGIMTIVRGFIILK